jgi:hypothetical protein
MAPVFSRASRSWCQPRDRTGAMGEQALSQESSVPMTLPNSLPAPRANPAICETVICPASLMRRRRPPSGPLAGPPALAACLVYSGTWAISTCGRKNSGSALAEDADPDAFAGVEFVQQIDKIPDQSGADKIQRRIVECGEKDTRFHPRADGFKGKRHCVVQSGQDLQIRRWRPRHVPRPAVMERLMPDRLAWLESALLVRVTKTG